MYSEDAVGTSENLLTVKLGLCFCVFCRTGDVQVGFETDPWCDAHHHQEVQEHPVRHQQTRRLQEPSLRYLHRLWRGQGEAVQYTTSVCGYVYT